MQKSFLTTLLALGVAAASFTSCSRANYAFSPSGSSYSETTRSNEVAAAATPEPELSASVDAATPAATVSPARAAATAEAREHTVPAVHRAGGRNAAAAPVGFTKADRKELKQVLRQAAQQQKKVVSPNSTAAEGKSQLVAALLCFFLGGFGVHRFYLGYTGRGILYIGLALTSFLIIPGIALLVLVLIDFVRILTGSLKPKGGEYATKL